MLLFLDVFLNAMCESAFYLANKPYAQMMPFFFSYEQSFENWEQSAFGNQFYCGAVLNKLSTFSTVSTLILLVNKTVHALTCDKQQQQRKTRGVENRSIFASTSMYLYINVTAF